MRRDPLKAKTSSRDMAKASSGMARGGVIKVEEGSMAKRDIRAKAKIVVKVMVKVERDMVTRDLAGPVE